MRLQISKSKNATSYYVIKSYRENGHNTSKVVEKLGTREQIMERTGCEDPEAWARAYIEELVYSDQCVPLARCFRASLTEGENHLHGD